MKGYFLKKLWCRVGGEVKHWSLASNELTRGKPWSDNEADVSKRQHRYLFTVQIGSLSTCLIPVFSFTKNECACSSQLFSATRAAARKQQALTGIRILTSTSCTIKPGLVVMWVDDKSIDLVPPDWHFILSQCFLKSEKALSSTRRKTASFIEARFFGVNYDVAPSFTGWMAHWGISQSSPKHLNVPKAHQWTQKGNAEFGEESRLNNKTKG